ncbi:YceD family protein [Roseibium sp.]|uniref:YceD family protein n=1 Tax=Roseibium sp. TaxID=1936156 RepID=UPI003A96B553
MANEKFPYSHKVDGERVGDQNIKICLEPDAASLKQIADAYDLEAIEKLKADLVLKPWGKRGVRVTGTFKTDIRQVCVVTLEPFVSTMKDEVDRTFLPASSKPRRPRDLNDAGEIEIDLDSIDPPDVMMDGMLDLGALICEQLALNIDPFPRKPGVAFTPPQSAGEAEDMADEAAPSAFAALAKLKEPPKE